MVDDNRLTCQIITDLNSSELQVPEKKNNLTNIIKALKVEFRAMKSDSNMKNNLTLKDLSLLIKHLTAIWIIHQLQAQTKESRSKTEDHSRFIAVRDICEICVIKE